MEKSSSVPVKKKSRALMEKSSSVPVNMKSRALMETLMEKSSSVPVNMKSRALMETLMEKSSSVPVNMDSEIHGRRWQSLGTHATNMQGHCVIKNSRSAGSELEVLMTAKNGELCIYFEQLRARIWRKFRLVDLRIDDLVLMYSMRDQNSFYIATPWKGRLDVSIYCTPAALSVNSWLLTLQHMGARMDVFKEKC
jgi:hypothetical protein